MSKSLINLDNNKYVLPTIHSAYRDKLTSEQKKSNITPEHVLSEYSKLLEDKETNQKKDLGRSITRLNKITKKIETFSNRNNSLILINELQRLKKEELLPPNYNMFNLNTESKSLENLTQKIEISSNLENKYIEIELQNKNLEVKFPLNLLSKNSDNVKFNYRDYLELITKFNSDFISSKNISYNFNKLNNKLLKNIYTILYTYFLNIKCSISKPRLYFTNDLIIIKLFYFPEFKIKSYLESSTKIIYRRLIKLYKLYNFKNSIKLRLRKKNSINKFRSKLESDRVFFQKGFESLRKDNSLNYKSPFLSLKKENLEELCELLSNLLFKPVQLEIVRLHYPFYDPNILTNILDKLTDYIKLRYVYNKIFKIALIKNPTKLVQRKRFSMLPGYLSGINIKFAGRLPTQRIIPRKTVKSIKIGSISRNKAILVETARFTNKNRRGSFSITISTGFSLAKK